MDDAEDSIVEDDLAGVEDEDENTDLKNRLRIHFLSLARQFFCYSSVMMFPIMAVILHLIPTPFPYPSNQDAVNIFFERQKKVMKYQTDVLIAATVGYIIGGVLMYSIGRKYTVLAVNLSHLPILIYLNVLGINNYTHILKMLFYAIRCAAFIAYFIYVAEITSPTYRAFFLGLYEFFRILTEKEIIPAFEEDTSKQLLSSSILAILSSSLAVFASETPFWLTLKGNPEKAEETFIWLRASTADTTEFDQTLARAEDIIEGDGIMRNILTQTFVVGAIFSVFLAICDYDPCEFKIELVHEYIYPAKREPTVFEYGDMRDLIRSHDPYRLDYSFYGQSIFLLFSFVVPRKVIYLISLIFGIFTALPVGLKLFSLESLMDITSYCVLAPYVGIKSLTQILPVEVYPAALREVGTTFTAVFVMVWKFIFLSTYTEPKIMFPTLWVFPLLTWTSFYVSLIGLTFIVIFIPETKNKSIFEMNDLKFIPFRDLRKVTAVEDEETVEEADV